MKREYALDVTPLLGPRTGTGRYAEELLRGLLDARRPDEALTLYALAARDVALGRPEPELLRTARSRDGVRVRRLVLPQRVLDLGWRRLERPWAETLLGDVDLVHGTAFRVPPTRRARALVTIHDLAPLRSPELVTPSFLTAFREQVSAAAARAAAIVCVSEHTRGDVVELLGVPRDRTHVIPLGVVRPQPPADADALVRALGVHDPFVLCVAPSHPRKNLPRIVAAFARARAAGLTNRLVLAGVPGHGEDALRGAIARERIDEHVIRAGSVSDAELAALYARADVLAYPSLHEGFGLPVLEAMAAGCPVLTSRGSALEEVAGDAARLVDPTSVDDIADGLAEVLTDAALRERLRAAGIARAAEFSWKRTAQGHLALYRALVEETT